MIESLLTLFNRIEEEDKVEKRMKKKKKKTVYKIGKKESITGPNLEYLEKISQQNKFLNKIQSVMVLCWRFIWIKNLSDHRRV